MKSLMLFGKEKWIKIPSKKMFKVWKRYTDKFYIEVICPYCHDTTSIRGMTSENRLRLNCSCELPEKPTPKRLEIMLTPRFLPKGWVRRANRKHEWFLDAEKDSSQPLVVYLSSFDHSVDNRGKDGYQATLGEFAGRSCYVAPLREAIYTAIDDCVTFMKKHNQKAKIKATLSKLSFNPKYL